MSKAMFNTFDAWIVPWNVLFTKLWIYDCFDYNYINNYHKLCDFYMGIGHSVHLLILGGFASNPDETLLTGINYEDILKIINE